MLKRDKDSFDSYATLEGVYVRIIIGITQDPKRISKLLAIHRGRKSTLIEMGPFISEEDAKNWLALLKSKICSMKEIVQEEECDEDKLWYGFTFEQMTD
ncbi:hypothetical protein [Desulfogranum japonicum]|uniref:hypothetical protein n=1 Tax=Desulfogranum japonicum TaxID=231447 RepID=UPI00129480ED|nr:hypothetical protein [Desulfogranum japonicum]